MSTDQVEQLDPSLGRRRLSMLGFVVLVIAYLAIIKLVGLATSGPADVTDGRLLTTTNVWWAMVVPLGAAFVFVYAVIAALGWWRPLLHDTKPVQPWVWFVPIVFGVVIVAGINYGTLGDRGAGFTLLLLLACLFVGFGEEGMFRCVGVNFLRQHGLSEGKVALWSSAIFGLVHVVNLIGGDARAFGQAIAVAFAGYFFYLIRRVSRSNILNSIIHGLFDFTILTGTAILAKGESLYPGASLAILAYLVCGIVLLIRRRHIEPAR